MDTPTLEQRYIEAFTNYMGYAPTVTKRGAHYRISHRGGSIGGRTDADLDRAIRDFARLSSIGGIAA